MYGISSSLLISDRNGIIGSFVSGSTLHAVPTVAKLYGFIFLAYGLVLLIPSNLF